MPISITGAKVLRVYEDGKKNSGKQSDFLGVNVYDKNGELAVEVRKA